MVLILSHLTKRQLFHIIVVACCAGVQVPFHILNPLQVVSIKFKSSLEKELSAGKTSRLHQQIAFSSEKANHLTLRANQQISIVLGLQADQLAAPSEIQDIWRRKMGENSSVQLAPGRKDKT